ncbi:hypothetical protein B296_00004517 [Ensete ventricosum]|uniref:Uncharacterized protein n=1 Tax=Ensete ventricosum TaxID=4639 RepID=A0A426YXI9_ENSVE|nr:hypothetical protein B296_00004517 [Ensete ventricosum]
MGVLKPIKPLNSISLEVDDSNLHQCGVGSSVEPKIALRVRDPPDQRRTCSSPRSRRSASPVASRSPSPSTSSENRSRDFLDPSSLLPSANKKRDQHMKETRKTRKVWIALQPASEFRVRGEADVEIALDSPRFSPQLVPVGADAGRRGCSLQLH